MDEINLNSEITDGDMEKSIENRCPSHLPLNNAERSFT